jgi:MHS family proline/betaine transporter-like MFS transporter
MAFASILGGYCSDRLGRKKIFGITIAAISILAPICSNYFVSGTFAQVVFAHITLSILAALYIGAEPALKYEL